MVFSFQHTPHPPRREVARRTGILSLPPGFSAQERTEGQPTPALIIGFSPTADAQGTLRHWHQCLSIPPGDGAQTSEPLLERPVFCFASSMYQNHLEMPKLYPQVLEEIQGLQGELGVAPRHTVLAGMSGGGSFAMAMALQYPRLAGGVLTNTGRVWEDVYRQIYHEQIYDEQIYGGAQTSQYRQGAPTWPQGLIQLASPTDFRFEEMKRDAQLFRWLGWQCYWQEFPGGHRVAPLQFYVRALAWLVHDCWQLNNLPPENSPQ